jgi:hypothetical protein
VVYKHGENPRSKNIYPGSFLSSPHAKRFSPHRRHPRPAAAIRHQPPPLPAPASPSRRQPPSTNTAAASHPNDPITVYSLWRRRRRGPGGHDRALDVEEEEAKAQEGMTTVVEGGNGSRLLSLFWAAAPRRQPSLSRHRVSQDPHLDLHLDLEHRQPGLANPSMVGGRAVGLRSSTVAATGGQQTLT